MGQGTENSGSKAFRSWKRKRAVSPQARCESPRVGRSSAPATYGVESSSRMSGEGPLMFVEKLLITLLVPSVMSFCFTYQP